jgi:hypothetical protein
MFVYGALALSGTLPQIIAAVAALGTAAYGLVDGSKALGGGVSQAGFGRIKRVIQWLFPGDSDDEKTLTPLTLGATLATLRANWINGTPLADQKAIAKTLIKLRLTAANAPTLARLVGVDPTTLTSVATKMAAGTALNQAEADVLGRFDLMLTTALDEGYQRADQRYRNWCKALAIIVSVLLAVVGGWTISGYPTLAAYLASNSCHMAVIAGLLATPLAPVAKDLSSAIQAGAKAVQALRG